MSRIPLLLLALVTAASLMACSPQEPEFSTEDQVPAGERTGDPTDGGDTTNGGDAGDGGETLTFVAADIDYESAPSSAPAGALTIELVNDDSILHDVTFAELGDEVVVEAEGGQTATGTVSLEPGTYTYYCSVPGHRDAGMEGTLEATG